ncbi:chromatin binding protein [Salix suchowensis]|nr:chromatin binding protein [Salix suchowensis]
MQQVSLSIAIFGEVCASSHHRHPLISNHAPRLLYRFPRPPEKPSLKQRITTFAAPLKGPFILKARTMLLIVVVIFVLVCHVVTHSLAFRRPHLEFSVQGTDGHLVEKHRSTGLGSDLYEVTKQHGAKGSFL